MTSTDAPTRTLRALPLVFEPLAPNPLPSDARIRVDPEGGAPLRCCLRDSRPGERIALIAVTPAGPRGRLSGDRPGVRARRPLPRSQPHRLSGGLPPARAGVPRLRLDGVDRR